jgi:hypothetical protein
VEAPAESQEFAGRRVLITAGEYRGCEGLCLGKSADGAGWAVCPDGTNVILTLRIGNQIDAAMIFARADFVKVCGPCLNQVLKAFAPLLRAS